MADNHLKIIETLAEALLPWEEYPIELTIEIQGQKYTLQNAEFNGYNSPEILTNKNQNHGKKT